MTRALALLIALIPAAASARECREEPVPRCETGYLWDAASGACVLPSG